MAALVVVLASRATAQVAILQIQIVDGEGAMHAPGSRHSRPLVVEVTDDTGRSVAGASVSFHLPEEGPSGVFANGLRTDVAVTDERGRATPRPLQLNREPGRFSIRVIATKEQATAGTIAFQNIAGEIHTVAVTAERPLEKTSMTVSSNQSRKTTAPEAPRRAVSAIPPPGHGHKKLVIILGAVGAGAAAGVLTTRAGGSSAATASAPPPSATTAAPPTIGAPSISVGKP